jgi:hypothetical protein
MRQWIFPHFPLTLPRTLPPFSCQPAHTARGEKARKGGGSTLVQDGTEWGTLRSAPVSCVLSAALSLRLLLCLSLRLLLRLSLSCALIVNQHSSSSSLFIAPSTRHSQRGTYGHVMMKKLSHTGAVPVTKTARSVKNTFYTERILYRSHVWVPVRESRGGLEELKRSRPLSSSHPWSQGTRRSSPRPTW